MKRLAILTLLLSIVVLSSGCQCGRLFRRGARCGVPTFKLPSLRGLRGAAPAAAPGCNQGCNPGFGTAPVSMPGATYESFPTGNPPIMSPEFSTEPIGGSYSQSPVYTNSPIVTHAPTISNGEMFSQGPVILHSQVASDPEPVYATKPVASSGETVFGPEIAPIPSGP